MIISLNPSHSSQIAITHSEALSGDFLPSLGVGFLTTFYQGVIGKTGVYIFGIIERGKVSGFVLGTKDSSKFFSLALRSNFLRLSFLLLCQLIRRPVLIKNVIETFLYPKKDVGPKAELVVIAVRKNCQGKGLGRDLVDVLEESFKKDGIRRYKLTVYADKKAVGFYEHLGYSCLSSFRLYGKMWFVYAKKVS